MAMDGRVLVFWKFAFDIIISVSIIFSFSTYNLTYMKDFSFSVFGVLRRFDYLSVPLDAYSLADYSGFKSQFCEQPKGDYTELCDWIRTFHIAGICYLIVCCLVLLMQAYNLISELSLMVYCNCQILRSWKSIHYVQPFFYLIAVLLYALISNIFFLPPPVGKSAEYAGTFLCGAWLMGGILVFTAFSAIYFLVIKSAVKQLELASNPGYQALVAHALSKPLVPSKAVDA